MAAVVLPPPPLPLTIGEEDDGEEEEVEEVDEKEGKDDAGGRRCTRLWMLHDAAISAGSSAPATRLWLDRAPPANV